MIINFTAAMTEYRLAKGWRILTYTISPPMILLFMYVMTLPFTGSSPFLYVFIPVSMAMIALFVYGMIDAYHGRVVIANDRVTVKSPFGVKTLMLEEIKGYKTDEHYIHVIPVETGKKKIKISTYVGKRNDIIDWMAARFENLELREVGNEIQEILQNNEYGITEAARARKLKEASQVAKAMNAVGWLAMAWVLFYPRPYEVAIAVAAFFPLVMMGVAYGYRGLIKGDDKKNSAYPSMATGFSVLVVSLSLRALFDFSILHYIDGWYLMGVIAVIFCALYVLPSGEWKLRRAGDYVFMGAMLLVMYLYSYGICVTANCMLDRSEGEYFNTTVIEKRVSKGKTYSYYLKLTAWGDLTEPEEVTVTREEYETVSVGEPVTVVQHAGYLKMPWVFLMMHQPE